MVDGYFLFARMNDKRIIDYETFENIYKLAVSANEEAKQSHEATRIFMDKLNDEYILQNKIDIDILISMFVHGFISDVSDREISKKLDKSIDEIQEKLMEINKELAKDE